MKRSAIAWCDFSSGDLNFTSGCTPLSRGCAHCYARRIYERFGRDHSIVTCHPDKLARLAKARFPQDGNKRGPHTKPMCFVCDTGDLFHKDVPDAFIAEALDVMALREDVIWQLLTKRPERFLHILWWMGEAWPGDSPHNLLSETSPGGVPDNIWFGVSVEDQATADERIPYLLETPAAVRFVSIEPCLAPVDLTEYLPYTLYTCQRCGEEFAEGETDHNGRHAYCGGEGDPQGNTAGLDWVICGFESGPDRRPGDPAWARGIYEQCQAAGVPFFGKQDSDLRPGKPLLIDGREVHEWPTTN